MLLTVLMARKKHILKTTSNIIVDDDEYGLMMDVIVLFKK